MSIKYGLEYVGFIDPWTDEERLSDEEIVRCMDCGRAFIGDAMPNIGEPVLCHRTDWHVRPDGFCAWGIRRDA